MSAILKLDNPGSVLADSKKAIAKAFGRAAEPMTVVRRFSAMWRTAC